MSDAFKEEDLARFRLFIETCRSNPQILHSLQLKFFKDFLESLGGSIPFENKSKSTSGTSAKKEEEPQEESDDELESDVELDLTLVIDGETELPPEMGEALKIPTEEEIEEANEKRSEAMSCVHEDVNKAIDLYTEAIKLNPTSAMLYAKRAGILIAQNRPHAAIIDCDEALRLNPDSAIAHKFRGRARSLLGQWLEAAQDLRLACKLDFDEQADEWLKNVQPNATKLEEHNRKYERRQKEKELKQRQAKLHKAQEEIKKAEGEKQKASGNPFAGMPGMGQGMPGMGQGMPGMGGDVPDFGGIFKDPEIMTALQDPEVAAAFQDVSSNPSNIFKYQSNPKIAAVINKLVSKFGGAGMPGGMGGFPTGQFSGSAPKSGDDLD